MKVTLTKIGNSKGIRLPKAILEQIEFHNEAELTIENNVLCVTPIKRKPREGWAEQIAEIRAKNGGKQEEMLDPEYIATEFDKEWEW